MGNRTFIALGLAVLLGGLNLTPVAAIAGGLHDGGGPTDRNRPMEAYHKPFTALPGQAEAFKKIDKVGETLPVFAQILKEKIKSVYWYLVPDELSGNADGEAVQFKSTQLACYQPTKGNSVRCSEPRLSAMSPEDAGMELVHELVMSLEQDEKSEDKTQAVIATIYEAQSPDPIRVQDALAANGFGAYFSVRQTQLRRAIITAAYAEDLAALIDRLTSHNCPVPSSPFDLNYYMMLLQGRNDDRGPMVKFDFKGIRGFNWYSPFSLLNGEKGFKTAIEDWGAASESASHLCYQAPNLIAKSVCNEINLSEKNFAGGQNVDLRNLVLQRDYWLFNFEDMEKDFARIREPLNTNADYIHLLGASAARSYYFGGEFVRAEDAWSGYGAEAPANDPITITGLEIMRRGIRERQVLLKKKPRDVQKVICASAIALQPLLNDMKQREQDACDTQFRN